MSSVVAASLVVLLLAAAVGSLVALSSSSGAEAMLAEGPVARARPLPGRSLQERLDAAGYDLPADSSVYAAQVFSGPGGGLTLQEFEAGGGARADNFWPASSIKVLVALGALDFLKSLDFTGAATIRAATGWTTTVRQLADDAIDESANDAYDRLVQIAGFDRLNATFLTAANGFPDTVIQRSYSGIDIRDTPALTITEGARSVTVPARSSTTTYECPDFGNCSNLYEMTESVRRVVLHDELPARQRFPFDPADIRALDVALLASDGWVEPGVTRALGRRALVYNKPGFAGGLDCVDVGLVDDLATGNRFLLGVTVPASSEAGCTVLAQVAEEVLEVLAT